MRAFFCDALLTKSKTKPKTMKTATKMMATSASVSVWKVDVLPALNASTKTPTNRPTFAIKPKEGTMRCLMKLKPATPL